MEKEVFKITIGSRTVSKSGNLGFYVAWVLSVPGVILCPYCYARHPPPLHRPPTQGERDWRGATYSEWENGRKLMPISHFFSLAPANATTPRELVYLQGIPMNNHHIWLKKYAILTMSLHKKVGYTILTIYAISSRNLALQYGRDHGLWYTYSWLAASSFALRRGRECRE